VSFLFLQTGSSEAQIDFIRRAQTGFSPEGQAPKSERSPICERHLSLAPSGATRAGWLFPCLRAGVLAPGSHKTPGEPELSADPVNGTGESADMRQWLRTGICPPACGSSMPPSRTIDTDR
ncbi:hypothetical protein P4O66_016591, partial [Electrophorus voltai]